MISVEDLMPILGWVIHYGDGTTYSSADGNWADAPDRDVQIVELLHESPYRDLVVGLDEYTLPGETAMKQGKWMDTNAFYALQRRVVEDG